MNSILKKIFIAKFNSMNNVENIDPNITPQNFLESQYDGYIAGDYTPKEVYSLLEDYANLKLMNEIHKNEKIIQTLNEQIRYLKHKS